MTGLKVTVDDQRLLQDTTVTSEKRCNRCHRILPTSEFYRSPVLKDGFENACKRCRAEQSKARTKANQAAVANKAATNAAVDTAIRHVHPINDTIGNIVKNTEAAKGVQPLPAVLAPVPAPIAAVSVEPKPSQSSYIPYEAMKVNPELAVAVLNNLTAAKGNPAANRRREVIAAVQLLLDMPENDCTAVIAMVQAYKGVLE